MPLSSNDQTKAKKTATLFVALAVIIVAAMVAAMVIIPYDPGTLAPATLSSNLCYGGNVTETDDYVFFRQRNGNLGRLSRENGEIKTGAVPFPDKITDGVFHETKYFKMVYPDGWTVGNSGIANSKKYKGLDAQVMYSGEAEDDSAAEKEANNTVAQWNQILSQAGDAAAGITVEQRTVTLEKCGATAYVVEIKKSDDKNPKIYSGYQLTMDFVCNGGLYHVQCYTEEGNTFDGSLDLAAMYGANLTIK